MPNDFSKKVSLYTKKLDILAAKASCTANLDGRVIGGVQRLRGGSRAHERLHIADWVAPRGRFVAVLIGREREYAAEVGLPAVAVEHIAHRCHSSGSSK